MGGLVWATLLLGLRAGLWVGGLILGVGVALFPILSRLFVWAANETFRIYSRHHLEQSPYRHALNLSALALANNLVIGFAIIFWSGAVLLALLVWLTSLTLWLAHIEVLDLRLSHSSQLEDYLNPWKH